MKSKKKENPFKLVTLKFPDGYCDLDYDSDTAPYTGKLCKINTTDPSDNTVYLEFEDGEELWWPGQYVVAYRISINKVTHSQKIITHERGKTKKKPKAVQHKKVEKSPKKVSLPKTHV